MMEDAIRRLELVADRLERHAQVRNQRRDRQIHWDASKSRAFDALVFMETFCLALPLAGHCALHGKCQGALRGTDHAKRFERY